MAFTEDLSVRYLDSRVYPNPITTAPATPTTPPNRKQHHRNIANTVMRPLWRK